MLNNFKNTIKNILNDHFDMIPLHIHITFDGQKYCINIDECGDDCKFIYGTDKNIVNKENNDWFSEDLNLICQKYIDQYIKDNNIVVEDGEGCAVSGGEAAPSSVSVDSGSEPVNNSMSDNNSNDQINIDKPEINSSKVGGLYVAYVCPGALPYFKFYRNRKKNKK